MASHSSTEADSLTPDNGAHAGQGPMDSFRQFKPRSAEEKWTGWWPCFSHELPCRPTSPSTQHSETSA